MEFQIGCRYLLTTSEWFYGPDGKKYKAVFGVVHGIHKAEEYLPAKPSRTSENWFINIGNMTIAGCQVKYGVLVDEVDCGPIRERLWNDVTKLYVEQERDSEIYDSTQYRTHSDDDGNTDDDGNYTEEEKRILEGMERYSRFY
jgi:hypothetical protein